MKNSTKQRVAHITLLLTSAVLLLVVSGCEYFKDVVIPKHDINEPSAIASVMVNGDIVAFGRNIDGSLTYRTSDRNTGFIAVAAAQDKGGAHRVVMAPALQYTCASPGSSFATRRIVDYVTLERTQEGQVGDVVSDGVFTAHVINFGQLRCARPGEVVTHATYTWHVQAEDFHGNVKEMQNATIEYRR